MSELDNHRIAEITVSTLRNRYPRTIGRNARLGSHGSGPESRIVSIFTNQGASGWGLLARGTEKWFALIGRRLSDIFDPAIGVISEDALALDFALHDLAGVILGKPVHEMLGGQGETAVPCYDGAIYLDDLDPDDEPRGIEAILANCERDCGLGYRAFKLKIGRGYKWMEPRAGVQRDIEVTWTVRERYPECEILVDANDGYAPEGFIEYFRSVADARLYWVEEPFREMREGLRKLRACIEERNPRTLIADGEATPDVPQLLELAGEGLLDVLLMDVVSFGFTRWREIMPRLHEIGVSASPHAWGEPLKTLYTAQIAAGLGNVPIVEGVPGEAVGADTSGYRLTDGMLELPSAPGFGISLYI